MENVFNLPVYNFFFSRTLEGKKYIFANLQLFRCLDIRYTLSSLITDVVGVETNGSFLQEKLSFKMLGLSFSSKLDCILI